MNAPFVAAGSVAAERVGDTQLMKVPKSRKRERMIATYQPKCVCDTLLPIRRENGNGYGYVHGNPRGIEYRPKDRTREGFLDCRRKVPCGCHARADVALSKPWNTRLLPSSDVIQEETGPQEIIDQPGKVCWFRVVTVCSNPTIKQRDAPAMKILPEPPCPRRNGNPSGIEQARHVLKIFLIEDHFLPSPQSTQLQRPMLLCKPSEANIASSSKHRPISKSGRIRRIQSINCR